MDLNGGVERFNQELAQFSMDQLFNHMTNMTSLTETARKAVTTLYQTATTRDFISAHDDMIVTQTGTELAIKEFRNLKQ